MIKKLDAIWIRRTVRYSCRTIFLTDGFMQLIPTSLWKMPIAPQLSKESIAKRFHTLGKKPAYMLN
jgi:hypothetical protein